MLADSLIASDNLDDVDDSVGCVSVGSLAEVVTPTGALLYFAGPNGIYQFDGARAISVSNEIQPTYASHLSSVNAGGISAAGEAVQRLPPMLARLRTCTLAKVRAAS